MNDADRTKFHADPAARQRPARAAAILAAAAMIPLLALPAFASAQYRVPQDGRALDANPQLGSGGSNSRVGGNVTDRYRADYTQRNYGNSVVTGDVSGGAGFRGAVPYRAAGQFNDFAAGSGVSNFAGRSTGVTTGGTLIDNAGSVRPYYNSATTIVAPPGLVSTPYTGGYQPPTSFSGNPGGLGGAYDPGAAAAGRSAYTGGANALSARLDNRISGGYEGPGGEGTEYGVPDNGYAPVPDALVSPVDARLGGGGQGYERPISPYTRLGVADGRLGGIEPDRVDRLRGELLRDREGRRLAAEQISGLLERRTNQKVANDGAQVDRRVNQERRVEGQLPEARLDPRVGPDGRPLPTDRELDEAGGRDAVDRLRLAGPAEQSEQYAQLAQRYERFRQDPYAEALRPLQRDREADQNQADAAGGLPGAEALPGVPDVRRPERVEQADGAAEPGPADPPVSVRSLAAGVGSPTLREVYQEAERLLSQGRYASAIARYEAAERLVPNQPLTLLGRAGAELGAGYYRRSAISLREALGGNAELTMARLDLAGLLGEERLEQVANTLRDRAAADRRDDEATFLLAFVAYGAGEYEKAAAFLDLAEQRSGDPFYGRLKTLWSLAPAAAEGGQAQPPQGDDQQPAAALPGLPPPAAEPPTDSAPTTGPAFDFNK